MLSRGDEGIMGKVGIAALTPKHNRDSYIQFPSLKHRCQTVMLSNLKSTHFLH